MDECCVPPPLPTCMSVNHRPEDCRGTVRRCPVCRTTVCWADGSADWIDEQLPGICDTCAAEIIEATS